MHFLTTYTIYVHRGGLEPVVAFQLSWGESILNGCLSQGETDNHSILHSDLRKI